MKTHHAEVKMDLKNQLPIILPLAIVWAENVHALIQNSGAALNEGERKIAQRVGVANPEKIRVIESDLVPQPDHPVLKEASLQTGMLSPATNGLTLGYSIFIKSGRKSTRLLSHECRHVHQYESYQSIAGFLAEYLQQIIDFGYYDAPLEIDARRNEISC